MHLQSEQTRKCHRDFNHLFASVTTENSAVTFCSSANVEISSRLTSYEFKMCLQSHRLEIFRV